MVEMKIGIMSPFVCLYGRRLLRKEAMQQTWARIEEHPDYRIKISFV